MGKGGKPSSQPQTDRRRERPLVTGPSNVGDLRSQFLAGINVNRRATRVDKKKNLQEKRKPPTEANLAKTYASNVPRKNQPLPPEKLAEGRKQSREEKEEINRR